MVTTEIAAPATIRATTGLHRPLLYMSAAMATLTLASVIGMLADDRQLLGESVWLKTFKFGFAFALYGLTLAWLLSLPHKGSRFTWWLGTVFAVTGVIDVGFIVLQAARGTFSHFNTAEDPVNSIGQTVFASGVPGLFFANVLIMVMLIWQRLADRPTTRAIQAGLVLAVVGMALGYLMGFTGKQLVRDANGDIVELVAGHTVLPDGAPGELVRDAGPGMPITQWSTVGGDLRVPHFVGLHGIQVLLLAAVVLAWLAHRHVWLRDERTRAVLVGVLALGYGGALVIVFTQAMRAQPLIHPDAATLAAAAAVLGFVALTTATVYTRARAELDARPRPTVRSSTA
ncbi:hypothetical protein IU433_03260 [Nocardia puris]|uniref:hypothetical protein n=1 Tax=Nocardia puris TaxID=208602 RepID=UPI001892E82C|nr:hypothetical protein [Nocardia puris]MBF6210028.1 hypothetical protein [Nocardia puris]MBF6368219.1 hypothetical protein [Nocardia puris]MBF6458062.1 hypothetical protein [Nocardia puris]